MIKRSLFLSVTLLLASTATVTAQDPKKTPDPEVTAKIAELGKAIKDRKGLRDKEAIQTIDELLSKHGDFHAKNLKTYIKTLGDAFKKKRKPEQSALFTACAAALGQIGGADASKALVKAYGSKIIAKRKEWAAVQDFVLESVGKTKDEKQVKFLLDEARRSPHDGVKVAAGKALRYFEESEFKVRKGIVKELIQGFANVANQANQNVGGGDNAESSTARRTLRAISDPWNETLQTLTGENIRTAPEWRSWWNDFKNKPKKWKHQTSS